MRKKFKMMLKVFIASIPIFLIAKIGLTQEIVDGISRGIPAISVLDKGSDVTEYSLSLQILALMTGITVLPSLVLGMTSFTRVIIVLSILRQALGTQSTPPNQVLIAIALFLTFFIMSPTLTILYDTSINPYLQETKPAQIAMQDGLGIIKNFFNK